MSQVFSDQLSIRVALKKNLLKYLVICQLILRSCVFDNGSFSYHVLSLRRQLGRNVCNTRVITCQTCPWRGIYKYESCSAFTMCNNEEHKLLEDAQLLQSYE